MGKRRQVVAGGYDALGNYKGKTTFTYSGTNTFTGTPVTDATTYKVYYPSTVTLDANGNVQPIADSFWQQTQNGDNTATHLQSKLLLFDEAANPLTETFSLVLKSSIMRFKLSGMSTNIGAIKSIIWTITTAGGEARSMTLNITNYTYTSGAELTAFLAFDPTFMNIGTSGKVKITQVGDKSYEWSTTNSGKSYAAGNRYKAAVSGTWEEVVPFIYTIRTTEPSTTHRIRLRSAASTIPAKLTIDWGDGSANTIINQGPAASQILASHPYTNAGDYTITIYSDQPNSSQIQFPQITFNRETTGENLLTAVLTPFPNMGATSFENFFKSCSRLTSIPAELFKNNTGATNFGYCFDCRRLSSIPAGLFANNTEASIFEYCFRGCHGLTSIPAELFSNNTKATTFKNCFYYCTGLTSIPATLFNNNTLATSFWSCFANCEALTSIPAGLFDTNTLATNFSSCFMNCFSLNGSIPAGLFYNNEQAESFSSCFANCSNLTGTTPTGLFVNNTEATNFYQCFFNCKRLQLTSDIFPDPATNPDFFKDRDMNFSGCFYSIGTNVVSPGTAPALWNFNKGTGTWTTTDCFRYAKVTDYNNIPSAWGGGGA